MTNSSRTPEPATRLRLDLNLLNIFDAVMTERHVTRAAERLDMTQSAVSNALNRLRKQLGDQLFVKTPKGVEPTHRALALWPRIHEAIEDLHLTMNPTAFDPKTARQQVRIALPDITAALIAPHLYNTVYQKSPGTSLLFVPHEPSSTGSRLMRGELDFALVIDPPRAAVIQSLPLWSDRFVLVARESHPFMKNAISLADFQNAPQVAVSEASQGEPPEMIDRTLKDRQLTRNVCLSVNQHSILPGILRNSDLIAVVPARFASAPHIREGLGIRPLPLESPEAVVYLCWHLRSENNPASIWLKERLLEAAHLVSIETERFLSGI